MKPEKLRILEMIKELVNSIDKYLINFPNKEIELKRKIKESSYELLLIAYEANTTSDTNKRITLQERGIALIKLIDFMINQCYEKGIINGKKYFRFGELLETIIKYFTGWMNTYKTATGNKPA